MKMLPLATSLFTTTDNFGETALLRATHYGNTENYLFSKRTRELELLNRIGLQDIFSRDVKVTILDVAIQSENFDTWGMVASNYCTPLSGGVFTWQTKSPQSRVSCMRMVLVMNWQLIWSTRVIGCTGLSQGFHVLILLGVASAPGDLWYWLILGRWGLPAGGDPATFRPKLCSHHAALIEPHRSLTRCVFFLAYLFFLLSGHPPFGSFIMSLEELDDLTILDAELAGPALEAEDLHPQVVPEGMTMNALPDDAIGLYAHHFQKGGLRVPFSSFFLKWHHGSSVADPFPKPSEYDASDVTKLWEVVISLRKPPPRPLYVACLSNVWKHAVLSMAEFLRLPNFKGCKVVVDALMSPSMARVTHLANPAKRLEDIPPKTRDMVMAKIPCRKVFDDKEKKKRKAEEKAAANPPAANIQAEKVNKDAGKEGPRKKRKVNTGSQVQPDSEHVSSPTPLNHVKPLETLVDEEYVSPVGSAGRMGVLWNQTDEHITPPPLIHVSELMTGGKGVQENVDATFVNEGHRDNEGGLSDRRPETMEKLVHDLAAPDAEATASKFFRFEALIEEHADLVYAYESCKDVKAHYKDCKKELVKAQAAYDEKVSEYDQLSKNYEGALTRKKSLQERLEELEEERKETDQLNTWKANCIKQLEETLKGEMVRQRIINQYLPTFVRRLHQSAEYKRALAEVFSLAVGKGFIDGISLGRKDADIQAILKATPNVDPTSSATFMDAYEKLFDQRYPYVDKVVRMYLLDPSKLQNIMPDKTGATPGGGPCDTPTASYA
ncbi:hypothetical protein Tco_0178798 [Tanacetum coccineum]